METTFIYVLRDPETQQVRYVGKSDRPRARWLAHKSKCVARATYCQRWLATLRDKGLAPLVEVVEEVPSDTWPDRECYWISFYRDGGSPLTNSTRGGLGGVGHKVSAETRQRLSAIMKAAGRRPPPMTPEQIERQTEQKRRRRYSPEQRERMAAGKRGVKLTPEHRASLSRAKYVMFDRKPELRDNLSRHFGRLTDEQVIEVWELAVKGELTNDAIGRRFGIPASTVSEIRHRKRYKHVVLPMVEALDPRRMRGDIRADEIVRLFKDGLSKKQISDAVKMTTVHIARVLKRNLAGSTSDLRTGQVAYLEADE